MALKWIVATIGAGGICMLLGSVRITIAPELEFLSPFGLLLAGLPLGAVFTTIQLVSLKKHLPGLGVGWIVAGAVGWQITVWSVAIAFICGWDINKIDQWLIPAFALGVSGLGTAQWYVLKDVFQCAGWWIPGTIVAATAGLLAAMDTASWNVYAAIGLAVLVYGILTGVCVSRMRPRKPAGRVDIDASPTLP